MQPHRQQPRLGQVRSQSLVEQGQRLVRAEGRHSRAGHPLEVGLAETPGYPGRLSPQAPRQRHRGKTGRSPVHRKRVEERVGGGVVALARPTEHGRGRRERHECRQVVPPRQLVEVPGRVDLGFQHVAHSLAGQRRDHAIVGQAGRVHDGGQRAPGGHRGKHGRHRLPVGHVAGYDVRLGAQAGQLVDEVGHTRGIGPTAAGEQQVAYPPPPNQVACEQAAEDAGPAGDQHSPVRVQAGRLAPLVPVIGGHPFQSGDERRAVANRYLWLAEADDRRQRAPRLIRTVEIHKNEPIRVLGLGGPKQAERRDRRQVLGRTGLFDTGPSRDDKPRRFEALVGQPPLGDVQYLPGRGMRVRDDVAGQRRVERDDDDRRNGRAAVDGRRERLQARDGLDAAEGCHAVPDHHPGTRVRGARISRRS